jgi:hypothetical protein
MFVSLMTIWHFLEVKGFSPACVERKPFLLRALESALPFPKVRHKFAAELGGTTFSAASL